MVPYHSTITSSLRRITPFPIRWSWERIVCTVWYLGATQKDDNIEIVFLFKHDVYYYYFMLLSKPLRAD